MSPAIWTSVLKLMSFKYPPTDTNGSKNISRPASEIPVFLKINVEPIAPAERITLLASMISSWPSFMYFTPLAFPFSVNTSTTSASVINVAPASTASSTKSFPDHFASAGHPNAHFPHWMQSSSLIAFGIFNVSRPNSLPASRNACVPFPMWESSS